MATEYQILDGDQVIDQILASEEFMRLQYPDGNYRPVVTTKPAAVEPTEPEPTPARRVITIRAFKQRFTQAERVAVRLAGTDDPTRSMAEREQAATLADWQDILNSVQFVDLDFSETVAAVQLMERVGLLAEGRGTEILEAEILPEERPESYTA